MTSIRENRTKFNNIWPAKFLFPAEEALSLRLAKKNLVSIFLPAQVVHVEDHEYQGLLSHCIDALDFLPLRPDSAFDQIWKALDAEFFRLKKQLGGPANISRFAVFSIHIDGNVNCSNSHHAIASRMPLQTCEFFAKRILDSTTNPNEHSAQFIKRIEQTLGVQLLKDIHSKYDYGWLTPANRAETQRKLGGLLKLIIAGKQVSLASGSYQLTDSQIANLLISTIMPQFRNERFHGTVRPPFRSSSATLKTYAHSYFLLIYAYALMCEVFLYRGFGVIAPSAVVDATNANLDRYIAVLGDQQNA